ncbi:nucleoside-diphosphate-sugar epimerase [Stagonosporopsis vannaccii]|nr:nucleoside-diphosphate-sugar epimerase [Stagonosporopsis vannaccii]
MSARLFCTGLTGYIGGDFLHVVSSEHPEWQIRALCRDRSKGEKLKQIYPQVTPVLGDLSSLNIIEEEASKADVILHFASCDDVGSAEAIARGMANRKTESAGHWIHTSGALVMATESLRNNAYGVELDQKYDDWNGVEELVSLPDDAPHRHVDKIVLEAASKHAIVCPPTVYGPSRGIGNPSSMQINQIAQVFLLHGEAFQINEGRNIWHEVHVQDLTDIYVSLTEAAITGSKPATWNKEGYYLAESGAFYWGDVCKAIGDYGFSKGFLRKPGVQSLDTRAANSLWYRYGFFVGTTSRGEAIRAKRLLDWAPHRPSLTTTIPWIVDFEAKRLGLVPV